MTILQQPNYPSTLPHITVDLRPGVYVLAVSGGVDSVTLLQLLIKKYGKNRAYKFIVAHLDHGIRKDATQDRLFVAQMAESFGIPFVFHEAALGPNASEDAARRVRYDFLKKIQTSSGATAIITAHHQDDHVETILMNLARGTHIAGINSLRSTREVHRPLLIYPKSLLVDYATVHGLEWREDSTNRDTSYRRNHFRHVVVPKMTTKQRAELLSHAAKIKIIDQQLQTEIDKYLEFTKDPTIIDRKHFNHLPHRVAIAVLVYWLKKNSIRNFDSRLLERLVIAAKTKPATTQIDVKNGAHISITKTSLVLHANTP